MRDKPTGETVFKWNDQQAKRLRLDLKAAGIPYKLNGEYADFHAFRHTYITRLSTNKDVALPTAQKLARHSTITLTMRYTHVDTDQLYKSLKALPGLDRQAERKDQGEAKAE